MFAKILRKAFLILFVVSRDASTLTGRIRDYSFTRVVKLNAKILPDIFG